MFSYRPSRFLLALLLVTWAAPAAVEAAISEPHDIFYGVVSVDGKPLKDAALTLRSGPEDETILARGASRGSGDSPGFFTLYVLLEQPAFSGEPKTPGVARAGDSARLYVGETAVTEIHVAGRGMATRVDAALISRGDGTPIGEAKDLDDDGLPDFLDNCSLANPDQADANGNGIGDPCEDQATLPASMQFVTDPGNPADPETGLGALAYDFEIIDREVTNAEYQAFLSAVARASDPAGLYSDHMASDPRGGIVRSGEPGAYQYRVKPNMSRKPVNYVSWFDAARYANWLENETPSGPQGNETTETGAFDLGVVDAGANAVPTWSATRSLPTEDEFYKAAYYDPTLGAEGGYWLYPTRDDIEPVVATANELGSVTNASQSTANYGSGANWNVQDGNVTSVGSADSLTHYGAADLGGNVAEWLAADAEEGMRVVRGGSYRDDRFALESLAGETDRSEVLRAPSYEGPDVGFRTVIVPVPELSAQLLSLSVLVSVAALRAKRHA
jgi:sulfatase modifying factor 1